MTDREMLFMIYGTLTSMYLQSDITGPILERIRSSLRDHLFESVEKEPVHPSKFEHKKVLLNNCEKL